MKKLLASLALAAALIAPQIAPMSVSAQSSASDYTSAARYDDLGRVVGTIAPDPDGPGGNTHLATRTTYDARSLPTKVETGRLAAWQNETIAPANWTGFTRHTQVDTTYDANRRKIKEVSRASDLSIVSVVQYSYDSWGRPECTAVRMNPAVYGSLPSSACTLGTEGSDGPDRITKTIYNNAGEVLQIRKAVGTSIEIADVSYSYTGNGKIEHVVDANGNKAKLSYDDYDRQVEWAFPDKVGPTGFDSSTPTTAMTTAGAISPTDREIYAYDANGNRTSLTKRDGSVINYTYDALNRLTKKDLPNTRPELHSTHRRDVYYAYDLRGLQTHARFSSHSGVGIAYTYDGFGRLTAETQNSDGNLRTIASAYDAHGNRTSMTYADNGKINYTYDKLDRFTGASWVNPLNGANVGFAGTTFDARGQLTGLGLASASTNYTYDNAGRLSSLGFGFSGSAHDVTWGYARNPASQIISETQDNSDYSWDGHDTFGRVYSTNGLNQYTAAGNQSYCYDDNGNLTADGDTSIGDGYVYLYDYENRLVQMRDRGSGNTNCNALSYAGALKAELHYDPTGRLYQLGGGTHRFLYDGNALVAEYNASGGMIRRYAHATNVEADDPLVWWEGSTMSCIGTRFLHADPRGSITALGDCWGNRQVVNTYDEYGIPDQSATISNFTTKGRFRYTGQMWIPELGMYYYKARIYSPKLGRFMQTDPIGYEDQFNLYAYVGNDPINAVDPTGTETKKRWFEVGGRVIIVTDGRFEHISDGHNPGGSADSQFGEELSYQAISRIAAETIDRALENGAVEWQDNNTSVYEAREGSLLRDLFHGEFGSEGETYARVVATPLDMIGNENLREEVMAVYEQLLPEIVSNMAKYDRTGSPPTVLVVMTVYPIHEEDRVTRDR